MARHLVSYDDLDAPSSMSLQTAIVTSSPNSISGATKQHTAENSTTTVSPPAKKRRCDEACKEGSDSRAVGNSFNGAREGGEINSGNTGISSSLRSLPPKPPVKKRGKLKRRSGRDTGVRLAGIASNTACKGDASIATQHWDDPGAQADGISYNEEVYGDVANARGNRDDGEWEDGDGEEGVEEIKNDDGDDDDDTRELTHEEVWDDSALIAAWDAASEEYEAMHGKAKRWKKERVHKSPLWYNIPPDKSAPSSSKGKGNAKWDVSGISSAAEGRSHEVSGAKDEVSSVPLNFDTYVPTHDASLAFSGPPPLPETTQGHLRNIAAHYSSILPAPQFTTQNESGSPISANLPSLGAATLSADEAFSRALGAMYWCGYWTAVYHVRRTHEQGTSSTTNYVETENPEEETEMLVSTQR